MIRRIALLAVLLAGCAHGKMGQVDTALEKNVITKTTPIFVEPISTQYAGISGDKAGKADVVAKEKSTIESTFHQKIAEALRAKGYNATAVSKGKTSGIVISGFVTKIEHGSAAARYFAGMGAGSSNMFTDFKIEDRSKKKVLSKFQIIATSGGESGFGSYLKEHLSNGAKQVVEYIQKAQ